MPLTCDIIVLGATPGGTMAAVAAARRGCSVLLLERTAHIGGLPANGLGATDIGTRGATGGLFLEFVRRIKAHYVDTYGATSPQAKDCSDGYHFEASVAEGVFEAMIAEQPRITVLRGRQFDAAPANLLFEHGQLRGLTVVDRASGQRETYLANVLIDGTYEGDLAAAAGCPFETRREGAEEYHEPRAGVVYIQWGGKQPGPGSTGAGSNTIQAFNYRLCLTTREANRRPITKPATYNRDEYVGLIEDVAQGRHTGTGNPPSGIGWLTNMVTLPNGKTDSNNQHLAFLSTDLPEENYAWPTADWAWRDDFARRLRDYTLGLLWFAQNDPALPEAFRRACSAWGLAKDEYVDNDNFPRQVYVREGRRILGEHLFTAHDALPQAPGRRPPLHADSITASHYALDSHAHHKREAGRVALDGFFSYPTAPYTVPYGVMLPQRAENLLTPVPVSGTHVGFSTLRMEPCWMAMGQAAGTAAALSVQSGHSVRELNRDWLRDALLTDGAILVYFRDVAPGHPQFVPLQKLALRGLIDDWNARLTEPVTKEDLAHWCAGLGIAPPADITTGITQRGAAIAAVVAQSEKAVG